MAILGRPYPLFYLSKNGKSGVNPIVANIRKADGSLMTPLTLVEMTEPGFEGRYLANIYTVAGTDPEGEYLIAINEPDGHKAIHRVSFESASNGGTPGDIGINRRSVLEAEVSQKQNIIADIIEKDIIAESIGEQRIEATFYRDDLDYFLDNNQFEGTLE